MAGSTIRVAVVGTGFGQKIHLPGFQAHHRTQVVAVCNHDLAKARDIAQAHDISHACQTVEEVVALPDVDAVSITTPPFLHYPQAKTVLEAGKHVLLEKPTTLNVTEALELYRLAQHKNAIAGLDFEFRFAPSWQRLHELLRENYVGTKRFISIDWLVPGRADPNRSWNWYAQKEKGGGALGAVGSHIFDYVDWLFGRVDRLSARLKTTIPQRPDPQTGEWKAADSDDVCSIQMDLADGTLCQVNLSSATYAARGHWVEVYGDRGTLVLGSDNLSDYVHGFKLYGAPAGEELKELEIPERLHFPKTYSDGRLAPFIRVVNHWVECIDAGQMTAPSLREGVYSQLLMDLTHRSNETNAWIDVPPFEQFIDS
ncbi:MAG: Gfo/Idh/MocA family protein [Thainema sp.]